MTSLFDVEAGKQAGFRMPLDMLVGKVDVQPANGQRSKPSAMRKLLFGGNTTSIGMLNGRHGRARKLAVGRWQAHWKGDLALYRGHRLERELQIAK